ncbi:hypothetical protein K1719_023148 [Acacia pycnantha]|nr:hypothetical protein K1719_023148 [Acacia pycnantha]
MATQYGIKFFVHFITNHFGNLVAKVCECLLRRGPSLSSNWVGSLKNNCVQAFILEQEASSVTIVKMCVELLEGLLRDGRLTLKQMVDRASQRKENAVPLDVVQESLHKLLMLRYAERCPSPEPVISPPVEQA